MPKKRWRPTKGGDGGVLPKVDVRLGTNTDLARNANSRRAMTCVERDDWNKLEATTDPYDRAHSVRDGANMLIPAGMSVRGKEVPVKALNAKPRLYPACYMVAGKVSFETAAEKLHEAQKRLASDGGRKSQFDLAPAHVHHNKAIAQYESMFGKDAAADVRNARLSKDSRTRKEKRNDDLADKWAAAHGVDLSEGSGRRGRD